LAKLEYVYSRRYLHSGATMNIGDLQVNV